MNLIVIPFHDWKKCEQEGFRTRDAHFMEEFGRHPLVDKLLVINRPTSLAEMVILRKKWRVSTGTTLSLTATTCLSQVNEKTYTLDIRVPDFIQPLLLQRKWIPQAFAKQSVGQAVKEALRTLGIEEDYSIFISAPLYVPLVKQLSPRVFAFDAQDNLLKQALYKTVPNLAAYYTYCIQKADVISANSAETTRWLSENRSENRSDPQHIANGVSPEVFSSEKKYIEPDDVAKIPHPRVGYAGKMQEMFDVKLMSAVVEKSPHINFVFIGQQLNPKWMQPLWQYANVFYLGDKKYDLLPAYLAAFDLCIIPYRVEAQHGGDPIKFYEYLAMGKPVVTTNIGGVGEFKEYPQVRITDDPEKFGEDIEYFLNHLKQGQGISSKELPFSTFWQSKANTILENILEKDRFVSDNYPQ